MTRWKRELFVSIKQGTIFVHYILAKFKSRNLADSKSFRQARFVNAALFWFLTKQKSRTGKLVAQRDCFNGQYIIFKDDGPFILLKSVKDDIEVGCRA